MLGDVTCHHLIFSKEQQTPLDGSIFIHFLLVSWWKHCFGTTKLSPKSFLAGRKFGLVAPFTSTRVLYKI